MLTIQQEIELKIDHIKQFSADDVEKYGCSKLGGTKSALKAAYELVELLKQKKSELK